MVFRRSSKLENSLTNTRQSFFDRIGSLLARSDITDETWEELEALLIQSDVGVDTTVDLVDALRDRVSRDRIHRADELQGLLKMELRSVLQTNGHHYLQAAGRPLSVVLVVGVNGSGKTTSIAKLARYHQLRGDKVLLAAADTFRAAAIDQLAVWADRLDVELIAHQPGADPGAVLYDAINAAEARQADVVIADTAGRLHTKHNLMQELRKVHRVAGKRLPGAPHETILALDATTGQNGLTQARTFNEAVNVTGLFLAKLDGTAKGGIVFAVARELRLPILFVGTGEQADDIAEFDAAEFVEALFR
ncbi:MAG: signal recognition particle-docking protein FtsY [Anaerolineales bacterium]|jgi:fused signal recognition particle receptor|nr:MAG: signal recognition particle-docking protein FtsY [Anaerolineales bacterium]